MNTHYRFHNLLRLFVYNKSKAQKIAWQISFTDNYTFPLNNGSKINSHHLGGLSIKIYNNSKLFNVLFERSFMNVFYSAVKICCIITHTHTKYNRQDGKKLQILWQIIQIIIVIIKYHIITLFIFKMYYNKILLLLQ